ncbi:MAG: hypothetical protein KBT02_12040 [Treponema sp.]|nr:hypothetical protein [Candidatus Treponema caballi]
MTDKTKKVFFSFLIFLALIMLTGCKEKEGVIAMTKEYALWSTYLEKNDACLDDIATNLLTDVSWKAKKADDKWTVTLKGKVQTEYPDPTITKAVNYYLSSISADLSQYTLSFDFVYKYGSPHYAGGKVSNGSDTEVMTSAEEEELLNTFYLLYKTIFLKK